VQAVAAELSSLAEQHIEQLLEDQAMVIVAPLIDEFAHTLLWSPISCSQACGNSAKLKLLVAGRSTTCRHRLCGRCEQPQCFPCRLLCRPFTHTANRQASKNLEDSLTGAHDDLAKDMSAQLAQLRGEVEDLATRTDGAVRAQQAQPANTRIAITASPTPLDLSPSICLPPARMSTSH